MYRWRTLNAEQRRIELADRIHNRKPWHRPPHYESEGQFLLTAACYEHKPHIGFSDDRLRAFQTDLLELLGEHASETHAWCILPNHYHVLVLTDTLLPLLAALGKLHGRSSFDWNKSESTRGRKVWHGISDRSMRSERHYFTTLNYIHHNPVKHGLVERWQDWEFTSAHEFLDSTDEAEAKRIWQDHPLLDYGSKWDP